MSEADREWLRENSKVGGKFKRCVKCNELKTIDRFDGAYSLVREADDTCLKCRFHPLPEGGLPKIRNCHTCRAKLPRKYFGGRRHSHYPECKRYVTCDFCSAKAEDALWTKRREEKLRFEAEQQLAAEAEWWERNAGNVAQWAREYSLEGMVERLAEEGRQRQAAELRATPPWADPKKIAAIYDEAARLTKETGVPHHVDHIVPLQGPIATYGPFTGMRIVFGLHWEENLRVIPARENVVKGNRYWPDMPEEERAAHKILRIPS
ncbi:hypothetical protein LMG22037_06604 [Paraburkholderia phenoliruptrix]|uniref:HNH nuclease domain-containing protein n=1 Tax=Paraburkholderia phenoliruptrix TaxID=252970 RepID=A0A6J5CPH3_9BURK|nr:hypothetical protein [Paraburkholderia phenoliruptrix]CAB3742457.1 hypothetical protein LMG22037_06604 [Paraburkholderia phenoliruptrix]